MFKANVLFCEIKRVLESIRSFKLVCWSKFLKWAQSYLIFQRLALPTEETVSCKEASTQNAFSKDKYFGSLPTHMITQTPRGMQIAENIQEWCQELLSKLVSIAGEVTGTTEKKYWKPCISFLEENWLPRVILFIFVLQNLH